MGNILSILLVFFLIFIQVHWKPELALGSWAPHHSECARTSTPVFPRKYISRNCSCRAKLGKATWYTPKTEYWLQEVLLWDYEKAVPERLVASNMAYRNQFLFVQGKRLLIWEVLNILKQMLFSFFFSFHFWCHSMTADSSASGVKLCQTHFSAMLHEELA